jgi:hypothetical protein
MGMLVAASAGAQQIDIPGPPGSVAFGSAAIVLPNGNFVVTDPNAGPSNQGAVHLYSPAGTLISSLTGTAANDHIGNGYITVLKNGNVVIGSPFWHNGGAANAGAATWINGSTGLQGAVSAVNSLVGVLDGDEVGSAIRALSNGNYVVLSPNRRSGTKTNAGAVTWGNGSTGVSGTVSVSNSLLGSSADDLIGLNFRELSNGNYVVSSPFWTNGIHANAGAVTWADGSTGLSGVVSTSNSLFGMISGDSVGYGFVCALSNGNYVVSSPDWSNGGTESVGAVTWANGSTGLSGPVATTNSLIGTHAGDQVGSGGATALSNGNYVVSSPNWISGTKANAGAATWADGSAALVATVSASNSLVGTTAGDHIGQFVQPLTNGNYVVQSPDWTNGPFAGAGAVTWGNGNTGISGAVTATNSLIGSATLDNLGVNSVVALSNGNYVVLSNRASLATSNAGAATWADGSVGISGAVSAANSLVGSKDNDQVGAGGAIALSNGNYVVQSPNWANGPNASVGAATWADGSVGLTGPVSTANSLVGSKPGDQVGSGTGRALTNGNYVIASPNWANGSTATAGAVTWANGSTGLVGIVSAANSLVGTMTGDEVGGEVSYTNNGNYIVSTFDWHNVATIDVGAESVGRGTGGTVGPILATNSIRGTIAGVGQKMWGDYDNARDTLIMGQPAANIVSLFKADLLFLSGFE